jgi:hypothetical protein
MTQGLIATLLSLIGAWLFYRSRKRVFDRRNEYGQEIFESYRKKLTARTIDLLLAFIAIVIMLTGTIFLALQHLESWGWIVLAPIAWLFIVGYIPGGKCRPQDRPR